jgi:hypothetical protein
MLVAGFAALGLLVGNLLGLSATSFVKEFVSLVFVFVGGSVIALLHKLSNSDRRVAGSLLFALSVGTVVGIYAGVLVTEYRVLSPAVPRPMVSGQPSATDGGKTTDSNRYLRGSTLSEASTIELNRSLGLSIEDAYTQMYSLAVRYEMAIAKDK